MICPNCSGENVNVQMVTENQLKNKHHSVWYWIFIGWWLHPILWVCLTLPMLLIKIFAPKDKKLTTKHKSMAVCQDCGHHWNV